MKLPQMKQKTIKINQRSLESSQKTIKQELIQKEEKNNVLKSAVELFRVREDIIVFFFFEKGIFPFKDNVFKTKEEIKGKTKEEEIEMFVNNSIALIEKESKYINNDLFKEHFDLVPVALSKKLFEIKDANKNSKLVETRIDGAI